MVKPEAATAVIDLLMMGGVIYLNCTMMHGLTNLKLSDRLHHSISVNNTSHIRFYRGLPTITSATFLVATKLYAPPQFWS
jgi:hypothetical protein